MTGVFHKAGRHIAEATELVMCFGTVAAMVRVGVFWLDTARRLCDLPHWLTLNRCAWLDLIGSYQVELTGEGFWHGAC